MGDEALRGGGERLLALDAFRGATVAAMLLVNNPGSWAHVHAPLRHAEWHGWTPTDLIFPFFLFVVGVTTHLAIERRLADGAASRAMLAKIVRRGALIVLLGLALNAFPFVATGTIPGVEAPPVAERIAHHFETLRIPGVLQRIGVVYLLVGLWALWRARRGIPGVVPAIDAALIATILGGYWALLTLVPVPGSGARGSAVMAIPGETLAAWSDRLVFGANHLWSQSKTWDPEGALSTLPAIATALLGLLAGRWLTIEQRPIERVRVLVLVGTGLTVAGLMWDREFPINKNLWTSSFVVFTAGAAMLGLAVAFWLIDLKGWKRVAAPAVAFGVNPMLAFFGSGIMTRLLTLVKVEHEGRRVTLHRAIHETLFATWLPPEHASLAYAVTFVLVWLAILWLLWKRGWTWKI